MSIQKPRLFTAGTLVVQEACNVMRSEYSIFDDNGIRITQITQAGLLGRRVLGTGIRYDILDANEDGKEGDKLLAITDPSNVLGDIYKVLTPNGVQTVAAKTKRFSLKSRLTSSVKGLSGADADGGFRGKDYILTSKGHPIVKIDWKYCGLKGVVTGRDMYVLHLEPDLGEETRAVVIGTALVIDIVRRKNDEAAAVSVS